MLKSTHHHHIGWVAHFEWARGPRRPSTVAPHRREYRSRKRYVCASWPGGLRTSGRTYLRTVYIAKPEGQVVGFRASAIGTLAYRQPSLKKEPSSRLREPHYSKSRDLARSVSEKTLGYDHLKSHVTRAHGRRRPPGGRCRPHRTRRRRSQGPALVPSRLQRVGAASPEE
jgi:hypothetical protein